MYICSEAMGCELTPYKTEVSNSHANPHCHHVRPIQHITWFLMKSSGVATIRGIPRHPWLLVFFLDGLSVASTESSSFLDCLLLRLICATQLTLTDLHKPSRVEDALRLARQAKIEEALPNGAWKLARYDPQSANSSPFPH